MEKITDAQIDGVTEMLRQVLEGSNEQRRLQEAELLKLREDHSNELVVCLLHVISANAGEAIRTLACVLLRQMFSKLSSTHAQAWVNLTEETQELLKDKLLELIRREPLLSLRKKLGEAIAELAINTVGINPSTTWDALMLYLVESVMSEEKLALVTGFHTLIPLFTFFHEEMMAQKELFFQVFRKNLANEDMEVRLICVSAICTLLGIVDFPDAMYFGELLAPLLKSILWLSERNELSAEEGLKQLRDFVELEPKFFKSRLSLLSDFIGHIFHLESMSLRYLSLDVLVTLAERLAQNFRQDMNLLQEICNRTFKLMLSVDPEEEINIDYAMLGRKLLCRLLESVGDTLLLPGLLLMVDRCLTSPEADWKQIYAGLLTLAELGQFFQDTSKLAEVVPVLQRHLLNETNKVRSGVFKCIHKLSEDFEEDFALYHAAVMSMILIGLSDSSQLVIESAIQALGKFLEFLEPNSLGIYAQDILSRLVVRLQPTNTLEVVEAAVEVLTSLVELTDISTVFTEALQTLYGLVEKSQTDSQRSLRGKAIECLSAVCTSLGKEVCLGHASTVIQLLKNLQSNLSPSDSLHCNVLAAWQKILVSLGPEFAKYLDEVVPLLIQAASSPLETVIKTSAGSLLDIADQPLHTEDSSTKETILQTLLSMIDLLKEAYVPYIKQTAAAVIPLVNYKQNESIRGLAASLCASLVFYIRGSECITACREMLGIVWEAAQAEVDTDALVAQLGAIKCLIETPGQPFLSAEEVNAAGKYMLKILDSSLKRRERYMLTHRQTEESDQLVNDLNARDEDALHIAVSEALGAIFRTHSALSMNIVDFVYANVLRKFLESSYYDQKFAITVINHIISSVGAQLPHDKWTALAEALVRNADSNDDAVRATACQGLGVLAACSSNALFATYAQNVLQTLHNALQIPPSKSRKEFEAAREAAVGAVSKIVRFQSQAINHTEFTRLGLSDYFEEAQIQNES